MTIQKTEMPEGSNVIQFPKRETTEERKIREQKKLEAEILAKILERADKLGW